ncbi:MAG: hypothetical protein AAB835_02320, partial [Patescibacteria group bacterium]
TTDVFAFVQWRIVRDSRTGQDIRTGSFRSWLLEQNGNWTFSSNLNILTTPFSEPSKNDPKKRIIVGIQFTLVSGVHPERSREGSQRASASYGVHIVRIDQDDVATLVKEATNEKK